MLSLSLMYQWHTNKHTTGIPHAWKHKHKLCVRTGCVALCVFDLRSQHLAGNKCTLPECCAAHRDRARPDDEQGNNEDSGTSTPQIHTHTNPQNPTDIPVLRSALIQKYPSDVSCYVCHRKVEKHLCAKETFYRQQAHRVVTFWKIHSWGKVLEMSSLISSRLDSLSEESASGGDVHSVYVAKLKQNRKREGQSFYLVSTFSLSLCGRCRCGLPLLFGPGQADVIQLCRDRLQHRSTGIMREEGMTEATHDDWTETASAFCSTNSDGTSASNLRSHLFCGRIPNVSACALTCGCPLLTECWTEIMNFSETGRGALHRWLQHFSDRHQQINKGPRGGRTQMAAKCEDTLQWSDSYTEHMHCTLTPQIKDTSEQFATQCIRTEIVICTD